MVAFFKHDIQSWRGGTASLTAEQYRVYHFIVEQIMMEEGPVQVHERAYAGGCGMSVRLFQKTLNDLVQVGKLHLESGRISNSRAEKEIEFVRNHRENSKVGGKNSGNSRRESRGQNEKRNEINGDREVPLRRESNIYRGREEVEREKEKNDSPLPPEGDDFQSSDEGHDNPSVRTRPAREPRKFAWPRDWFEQFWNRYPKKEGKKKALDLLDAVRRKDETAFEVVMSGLEQYRAKIEDPKFYMQPERWVRGERWNDEKVDQIDRPRPTIASQRRVAL